MIDWAKQHNGVHRAEVHELLDSMPDVHNILASFPESRENFVWDVKVHMLMPGQYPCIPNWHYDNIPRVNNVQDFEAVRPDLPMYLWVSGGPLTEFRETGLIAPAEWIRFTQKDEHRGTICKDFYWRGFIRATHKEITPSRPRGADFLRRHSQVYLDAGNFSW